jgi:bacteriorhodopsin
MNTNSMIQTSFTITFISLLVSAVLNLIESFRTTLPHVRNILSLEACIAIIAAYFYSVFKRKTESSRDSGSINWKEITQLRYIDWAFTTPMMLLGLCLILAHHSKTVVSAIAFLGLVLLDYFMLYFGYLGETKQIERTSANIIGFIGYIGIFVLIFKNYVKNSKFNYAIFTIYAIIWASYGVVYFLDDYNKNLAINWLDLIAKSLVGIGMWAYFTKVVKF